MFSVPASTSGGKRKVAWINENSTQEWSIGRPEQGRLVCLLSCMDEVCYLLASPTGFEPVLPP